MPLSGPPLETPVVVSDLLARGLSMKPDEPALVSTAARWTWRELDDASRRLAGGLLGLGLKPGDRVASLMPNRVALIVHYLACLRAGLVTTPLNYRYTPPEIDHALGVSEASIILAHQERDADIAASQFASHLPKGVIRYTDPGCASDEGLTFDDLMAETSLAGDLAVVDPDSPAFVLFTSGSTGKPKGVTHTHRSFGHLLASTIANFQFEPQDVILPGASISHIGGIGFSLSALAAGGRVDVARTYVDEELLQLLRDTRPTVIVMLPAFLFRLIREDDATTEDFKSLRMCICGGDQVSGVLEEEFVRFNGPRRLGQLRHDGNWFCDGTAIWRNACRFRRQGPVPVTSFRFATKPERSCRQVRLVGCG